MAIAETNRTTSALNSKQPRIIKSPKHFENAFFQHLGQHPYEWILQRIKAGTDVKTIQYLYETIAEAISKMSNCTSVRFDDYYNRYLEIKLVSYKTTKVYNQLVRDKILDILESPTTSCVYKTLSDSEYLTILDSKLSEELLDYQKSKSLAKLADVLEVMSAIVKARGRSWDELTAIQKEKFEEYGSFDKRVFLFETRKMKEVPLNTGKHWTSEEELELKRLHEKGYTVMELSFCLKRSKSAIASRLVRLGLTPRQDFRLRE